MSVEMQIAVGAIISILVAIPSYFGAKYVWSKRQSQKVDSGRGYQAGGDINIKNDK